MEDKKMNSKQPGKAAELKKSEYVKDKEKQAAEKAETDRIHTQMEERKKNKKPLKEKLRSQKFRHSAAASAITVLGLVVLILINVVISALGAKFPSMNLDLTTGGMNSLSDTVKKVIDGVNNQTNIIIMGTEEQVRNNEILSSYNVKYSQVGIIAGKMAERNSKISVTYKDLDKDPTFATKYSSENLASGDVVVEGKRSYVVKSTDLFNVQSDSQTGSQQVYTQVGDALAAGVSNANSDNLPVVAFDTGHEEQLFSSPINSPVKKLFSSNNFATKDFNLLTDKIPDHTQLIFIGAPKTDYTDDEIKKLDAFLSSASNSNDRGLIVSTAVLDPTQVPKLAAFLKEWGITLENKVAMETDTSKYIMEQPAYLLAQAGNDITLNKNSSYTNLLVPMAQTMTVSSSVNGITTSALMKSSNTSYTVSPDDNSNSSASSKTKAESVLAAVGRKTVKAGNKTANASVAVCGSAFFFADGIVNANTYSNGTWSADLAKYMTGTTGSNAVTITPVQTNATDISLSSAGSTMIGLGIFTILLPLACFIVGIVVYRKRRKL